MTDEHDEHDATSCPQCRGQAEACRILGGYAEAMERMIKDGTFERLGREAAMRREQAFMDAFLGDGEARRPK